MGAGADFGSLYYDIPFTILNYTMMKRSLPFTAIAMFLLISGPLSLSGQNVLLSTDPTLGEILTDAGGNTLYYFTRDAAADASACTGG